MIRRGIVLPSRRFFAWTAFSILAPMTLALLSWALKADAARHSYGIGASLAVGTSSFFLIMGALELLKRIEKAGWTFEAPRLRNWAAYYGVWALTGLAIGWARAGVLQAAFDVTFHPGRFAFEVSICLYATLMVAFSLENQSMFMREAARKQEASRLAVRDLFASREAFVMASDLRRHEVLGLLERRVEPELGAVRAAVERLRVEGGQLAAEAYDELLVRLDHLRDAEIRKASHLLHPSIINVGLAPALRALARSRRDSLDFELEADPALLEGLPPSLRLQVYRIVEHAFELAARQRASRMRATLSSDREETMSLALDAWGHDLSNVRTSSGLALIDARVALMGGEWEVRSASEASVSLRLSCPKPQAAIPRR